MFEKKNFFFEKKKNDIFKNNLISVHTCAIFINQTSEYRRLEVSCPNIGENRGAGLNIS